MPLPPSPDKPLKIDRTGETHSPNLVDLSLDSAPANQELMLRAKIHREHKVRWGWTAEVGAGQAH